MGASRLPFPQHDQRGLEEIWAQHVLVSELVLTGLFALGL